MPCVIEGRVALGGTSVGAVTANKFLKWGQTYHKHMSQVGGVCGSE